MLDRMYEEDFHLVRSLFSQWVVSCSDDLDYKQSPITVYHEKAS